MNNMQSEKEVADLQNYKFFCILKIQTKIPSNCEGI